MKYELHIGSPTRSLIYTHAGIDKDLIETDDDSWDEWGKPMPPTTAGTVRHFRIKVANPPEGMILAARLAESGVARTCAVTYPGAYGVVTRVGVPNHPDLIMLDPVLETSAKRAIGRKFVASDALTPWDRSRIAVTPKGNLVALAVGSEIAIVINGDEAFSLSLDQFVQAFNGAIPGLRVEYDKPATALDYASLYLQGQPLEVVSRAAEAISAAVSEAERRAEANRDSE